MTWNASNLAMCHEHADMRIESEKEEDKESSACSLSPLSPE